MGAFAERVCFDLCKWMFVNRGADVQRYIKNNRTYEQQAAWRVEEAERYLKYFRRTVNLSGKVVLDYACGTGAVANAIRILAKPDHMIALDPYEESIAFGRQHFPDLDLRHIAKNESGLDDDSIDIAYTTDSFEHFENPSAVLTELHRVIKPGGYLLIHFIPWWGVDGSHLAGVIPIPWCHVFFSGQTLYRTARRVVRCDFYTPLAWDFDAEGNRLVDKYDRQDDFDSSYLNRLTIRGFRRCVREFTRDNRMLEVDWELSGFSGTVHRWAHWFAWLRRLPVIGEFANRGVYCAFRKVH